MLCPYGVRLGRYRNKQSANLQLKKNDDQSRQVLSRIHTEAEV